MGKVNSETKRWNDWDLVDVFDRGKKEITEEVDKHFKDYMLISEPEWGKIKQKITCKSGIK